MYAMVECLIGDGVQARGPASFEHVESSAISEYQTDSGKAACLHELCREGVAATGMAKPASGALRSGSTIIHASPPRTHSPAATAKDAVHPKRLAIAGVSDAVTAPPICAPLFMIPETEPDEEPPISADTDQKEL